jgi:hypothetical protein
MLLALAEALMVRAAVGLVPEDRFALAEQLRDLADQIERGQ